MKHIWIGYLLLTLVCPALVAAQNEVGEKKFEVGGQFSILNLSDPIAFDPDDPTRPQNRTEPGFGGRFGYNLNRFLAVESEINFFPRDPNEVRTNATGGRILQGLFGAKAGIRLNKIGFFGKVRPGFVSSDGASHADFPDGNGPDPNNRFGIRKVRKTQFTVDIGGVFEVYPTRRTIIRFDVGDTITRYPEIPFTCFPSGTLCPETPWTHRIQFSSGFGFRF